MNLSFSKTLVSRRSFFIVAAAALTVASMPMKAFAASTIWSTVKRTTVRGTTFSFLSGINVDKRVMAYTKVNANKTVAAGTMKARAVIVKDLKKNVLAAGKATSNVKGITHMASVELKNPVVGIQSRGQVNVYNTGWVSCNSTIAPYSLAPDLPVNENGQTLGTYEDVERGAVPDLIGIVADSGVDGYAYWEQFDAEDASDVIPVYAEDGATQIGVFSFGDK